jgi:capsular polysaccharide transport system permease protein
MTHREQHLRQGSFARFMHEMSEGSRRQGNVIFALIFRELKSRQDGSNILTLLAVLLEPALGVLALTAFWFIIRRVEIQGVHVALFLAVSYTGYAIVRRSIATVPRTIRSNRAFYAFPSVKPFDVVLSRFLLELFLTLVGGAVVFLLLWWYLGLSLNGNHLLEAGGVFGLIVLFSFGLCLFVGVYGTRFPLVHNTVQLFSRGLLFISCVMHPAIELPTDAQWYVSWNPITHGLELMRAELLGTQAFPDVSLNYLALWTIIMLFLGFMSYYANRFEVIKHD